MPSQTIPLQTELIRSSSVPLIDVFGLLHQFLVAPDAVSGAFGLMRAMVGPGLAVPLHSHHDPEVFCLLEGSMEFLKYDDAASHWITAAAGDTVCIPGNVKHALRNSSTTEATLFVIATPNVYNFLRELGKPYDPDRPAGPPTSEDMQRVLGLAAKYGYWIASPQENAEVGLTGF